MGDRVARLHVSAVHARDRLIWHFKFGDNNAFDGELRNEKREIQKKSPPKNKSRYENSNAKYERPKKFKPDPTSQ